MTIAMFGYKLEAPLPQDPQIIERIVAGCAKRSHEREFLLQFIKPILPGLSERVEAINFLAHEITQVNKTEVITFFLSELKNRRNSHSTIYEDLVLKLVHQNGDSVIKQYVDNLRLGKKGDMPSTFLSQRKYADGLVVGKIRSDIDDKDVSEYLRRKELIREIRQISQDMFFAVNNGLNESQILKFMSVFYHLRSLQTELSVNLLGLRKIVASSLANGTELQLVHVKCLRFVYPKEGGIRILTDTNDVVLEGVKGKYSPKSEVNLFPRLLNIREIFVRQGIPIQFIICCSDEDLKLLYPTGNPYLSSEQASVARANAHEYMRYLELRYREEFMFTTIDQLADMAGKRYHDLRQDILRDLARGGSKYVKPDYFEKDRVDHQYEYYQKLLGDGYTRQEARRSISEQTASVIALSELLSIIGQNVVLVEENRYGENKFIAGGKIPVFFTKLRDEIVFDIK